MSQPSIWKNAIFMRMFSSYSISMLGRWFDMVAIMILFGYVWEVDALMIALIPIAYAVPHAFLSQFAGILVDRFNKVKLMITADLFTAALTVALFLAPQPSIALLILLLRASLTVIHYPAQQALIKHVVEEKLIVKAVTLNGTVNELTKIIGPFIGGSLAAAFSPRICILVNAVAYFISALILINLLKKKEAHAVSETRNESTPKTPFWQSWRDGWSTVLKSRMLTVSIIFSLFGITAIQMVDVQLAVLFRDIAPGRPELIGWLMAATGAGALVMMLIMNRFNEIKSYGWVLGGSLLFIGVGFGCVGFLYVGVPSYLPVLLGFIAGLGVGLFTIGISYVLQKESSKETIGRVSGIFSSLTSMMILVAPLVGGILVSQWGAPLVFQAIGVSLTTIGLTGIILRRAIWCQNYKGEKSSLKKFKESF